MKKLIIEAEKNEENSNQILEFTKDIKKLDEDEKKIIENLYGK